MEEIDCDPCSTMRYLEVAPSIGLRSFVDRLWALDGHQSKTTPIAPILPDGHPEIIVHCGDPFVEMRGDGGLVVQSPILLAGQLRRSVNIRPGGEVRIVGA